MTSAVSAEAHPMVGRPIEEADTPALWVDLDALEHNIATMARRAADSGVEWRPHVKASKSPDLARMLIEGGATGITCAKVSVAAVMAAGGLDDILFANEIVGPRKIARLVRADVTLATALGRGVWVSSAGALIVAATSAYALLAARRRHLDPPPRIEA